MGVRRSNPALVSKSSWRSAETTATFLKFSAFASAASSATPFRTACRVQMRRSNSVSGSPGIPVPSTIARSSRFHACVDGLEEGQLRTVVRNEMCREDTRGGVEIPLIEVFDRRFFHLGPRTDRSSVKTPERQVDHGPMGIDAHKPPVRIVRP